MMRRVGATGTYRVKVPASVMGEKAIGARREGRDSFLGGEGTERFWRYLPGEGERAETALYRLGKRRQGRRKNRGLTGWPRARPNPPGVQTHARDYEDVRDAKNEGRNAQIAHEEQAPKRRHAKTNLHPEATTPPRRPTPPEHRNRVHHHNLHHEPTDPAPTPPPTPAHHPNPGGGLH